MSTLGFDSAMLNRLSIAPNFASPSGLFALATSMGFISGAAGWVMPQQQSSGSPNTSGYYRRFNYPKYYKTDSIFIKKFERDFATSRATNISFQLINAFPKSVTSIPVAYGDAEIMKVTVTMNYDRYIMRREYGPIGSPVTPGSIDAPGGISNLGTVNGVDQGVFGNTTGFDNLIAQQYNPSTPSII